MPGMAAIALAAPGRPVVISSGHVAGELKVRAEAGGVRAVLFKEQAFERLASIVHRILDRLAETAVPPG